MARNHALVRWYRAGQLTLVVLGFVALFNYVSWWWQAGWISSPLLAVMLAAAAAYNFAQLIGSWVLYLRAVRRDAPREPEGVDVDVFVTACREPVALVAKSLAAACAIRGRHRVWLLDDGDDPALERLARRLGAEYLTREGSKDAKAGNLNAALSKTRGDIIVIFDVDHVPRPDFLERSLGYFRDPSIGFVQVMLTFDHDDESWVARAAAESSVDFYNPTCMGADGMGSATLIGSNALIRRAALESIDGYRPGLAEDLATSIALHAAGWRSVYVAEPLAPGLAPPDLAAWFTQQSKWARGVFEVFVCDYFRMFCKLTWGQRLSYLVRCSYYWVGIPIVIHMTLTLLVLAFNEQVARVRFEEYFLRIAPVALVAVLMRQLSIQVWRHPSTRTRFLWRAVMLVFATWPIYVRAALDAALRVPAEFRPTPKSPGGELRVTWVLPQVLTVVALVAASWWFAWSGPREWLVTMLAIAALQAIPQIVMLYCSWRDAKGGAELPRVVGALADGALDTET